MLKNPLLAAAGAVLLVPAVALAQDPAPTTPDTTPPSAVLKINTTLNTIDSVLGQGIVFSADPSEDLTYTAKLVVKSKGKSIVAAKSIRAGDLYNSGGGFVEQTIPRGSDSAVKKLIKIKKGSKVSATLTLSLKDTAGNTATVTKTVKLKKRY
ncbi:hypothetical protein [Patulibacter minatonensis]|uniref:hypothetical protein n=1 Tax=Patulibacter minatonensis TaxID=298163 RepID=UPI00047C40A8|nr:hypothetical protein [Patulibacter minatonensis]